MTIVTADEALSEKARSYVRENACVKGSPNMTVRSFCEWVNSTLLPNATLEPGFPRKICLDTARTWLHFFGLSVKKSSKGLYFDGHERSDRCCCCSSAVPE